MEFSNGKKIRNFVQGIIFFGIASLVFGRPVMGVISKYNLPGIYNASPVTLTDGQGTAVAVDSQGRPILSTTTAFSITTNGTKGLVFFGGTSGSLTQNSNFYFDATTGTLRIGTSVTSTLVASSSVKFTGGDTFAGTEYKIGKTANANSITVEVPTGGSINLNSSGATMFSAGQFSAVVGGPIVATSFRSGNNAASNLWFTPLASNDASTHNIGMGIGGTDSAVSVTSTGDGAGGHGANLIGLGVNSKLDTLTALVATTTFGNGGPVTSPSNFKFRVVGESISQIPLIVQGLSGQTGNLIQGVTNAGALIFGVSPNGGIIANAVSGSYLGGSNTDANWQLTVDSNGTTNGVLKLLGRAGLTGDLFLVATSSGNVFKINNNGNLATSGTVQFAYLGAPGATGDFVCFGTSNPIGNLTHQAANCTVSSARYKEYIESLSPKELSEQVAKLRAVSFNYKKDGKGDIGFIAEEVASINPMLVVYTDDYSKEDLAFVRKNYPKSILVKDGKTYIPQTVDYARVTVLLTGAYQNLDVRVSSLEQQGNVWTKFIQLLKELINKF